MSTAQRVKLGGYFTPSSAVKLPVPTSNTIISLRNCLVMQFLQRRTGISGSIEELALSITKIILVLVVLLVVLDYLPR